MASKRGNGADGYRYIRETRTWPSVVGIVTGELVSQSFALFERRNGRAIRVGNCKTYEDALGFLNGNNQHTTKGNQ